MLKGIYILALAITLSGCSTMAGIGKDIQGDNRVQQTAG